MGKQGLPHGFVLPPKIQLTLWKNQVFLSPRKYLPANYSKDKANNLSQINTIQIGEDLGIVKVGKNNNTCPIWSSKDIGVIKRACIHCRWILSIIFHKINMLIMCVDKVFGIRIPEEIW